MPSLFLSSTYVFIENKKKPRQCRSSKCTRQVRVLAFRNNRYQRAFRGFNVSNCIVCTYNLLSIGCHFLCPQSFKPVCGSNGKTYSNNCALKRAHCKNKKIRKARNGSCKRKQSK